MNKKIGTVFYISLIITLIVASWGIFAPVHFEKVANSIFHFLTTNFGWLYLLAASSFVFFGIALASSRYGKVKLGKDDEEPEYDTLSWFAMLFSAGMGIGLVFWGVAEPISHFLHPPVGAGGTAKAAEKAMTYSFFHWGFHAWGCYSILAMTLAYFQFRKETPALISKTFKPLLGDKINGPLGKTIDILTVLATVAGVATSLGLGTIQINGGLNYLFGIPISSLVQVGIILLITVIYIVTAISGLDKGIKAIANLNLRVALILLVTVIIIGPTAKIFNMLTSGIGGYLSNLFNLGFNTRIYTNPDWMGSWTIFYLAWWIAWAPFVGTFIARISRGRTIREFVGGVLAVPSLASMIWFAAFGTSAINLNFTGSEKVVEAASKNVSTALFEIFAHYPLGFWISVVTIFLVFTFFITSANSATFVLAMISSKGDLNPTNKVKSVWGVVQAGLAIGLLISGGLEALQIASIAGAFPFAIIMILMCVSLYKSLREEELNS
ncbi:glycine betaine uptake BCCT transporter [Acetohalobium arabaticum]|nr:BCCT family transporter [Acetohalobium arabaticum]